LQISIAVHFHGAGCLFSSILIIIRKVIVDVANITIRGIEIMAGSGKSNFTQIIRGIIEIIIAKLT